MGEIVHFPTPYRIAYTTGEDEEYVTDGYGGTWETRDRGEAEDYRDTLAATWLGILFWIVEGR